MIYVIMVLLISLMPLSLKGWAMIFLIGQSLYLFPFVIFVQYLAINAYNKNNTLKDIRFARILQLIGMLLAYIFIVGGGDTEETYAMAFFPTTINSPIAVVSNCIAVIGWIGFLAATSFLIVRLFSLKNKTMSRKRIYVLSTILFVILLLPTVFSLGILITPES